MPYQKPSRNTDGIHWHEIRLRADAAWNEMSDEFSEKYYDSWRYQRSDPWGPFDTVGDPAGDERQFVLMQVMLVDMGTIMFHKINHRMNQLGEAGVIPQDDYRYVYERDHETGEILSTSDEVMFARDRLGQTMQELGTVSAKVMMDHYRQRIKDYNGDAFDFPDWTVP